MAIIQSLSYLLYNISDYQSRSPFTNMSLYPVHELPPRPFEEFFNTIVIPSSSFTKTVEN